MIPPSEFTENMLSVLQINLCDGDLDILITWTHQLKI